MHAFLANYLVGKVRLLCVCYEFNSFLFTHLGEILRVRLLNNTLPGFFKGLSGGACRSLKPLIGFADTHAGDVGFER